MPLLDESLNYIRFISGKVAFMNKKRKKRTYPPFYERTLPFAIGLLVILIFGMLIFTIVVGVGVLNFG